MRMPSLVGTRLRIATLLAAEVSRTLPLAWPRPDLPVCFATSARRPRPSSRWILVVLSVLMSAPSVRIAAGVAVLA